MPDLTDQLTSDPDFLQLPPQEQERMYQELIGQQPQSGFLNRVANTPAPFLAGAKVGELPGMAGAYLNARAGFLPGLAMNVLAPPVQAAGQFATQHAPEFEQAGGFLGRMAVPVLQAQGALAGGLQRFLSPQPDTTAGKVGTGVATATGLAQNFAPAIGATGRFLGGLLKSGKEIPTIFSEPRQMNLIEQARTAFANAWGNIGNTMEGKLAQLKNINLQPLIEQLSQRMGASDNFSQGVLNGISVARNMGDSTLESFLANPELAKGATGQQAQQVFNTLRQNPSTAQLIQMGRRPLGFLGKGAQFVQRANPEDYELLNFSNQVKETAIKAYPEEFPAAGKEFAKQNAFFKQHATTFSNPDTLLDAAKKGFQGPFAKRDIAQYLPSDITDRLLSLHGAKNLLRTAEIGGGTALGTYEFLKGISGGARGQQ